jgi:hypothetical protein
MLGWCGLLIDVNESERGSMDRNYLEKCHELAATDVLVSASTPQLTRRDAPHAHAYVSLEAEIPEVLYRGMKDFIGAHPNWDQYQVMSSALAHFLFQNGSESRAVSERYLDDLFSRSDH